MPASRLPVPAVATPLFGRDDDIAALDHLLVQEHVRLLTLTGSGGTGKTRLASAIAERVASAFDNTVYFVDLSAVADPAVVPASVAQAVGIQDSGSQPVQAILVEVLGERPALVILDNFEQLIGAAGLVADLVQSCPELVVLVTSREPLHLRAERVYPVAPLAVPDLQLS